MWIVKRDGHEYKASFQHPTSESAVIEAKRLSKNFPGVRFYVMQAVKYFVSENIVEEHNISRPVENHEEHCVNYKPAL